MTVSRTDLTKELDDFRIKMENMAIGELRKLAHQNYGLKLTREHTKDDIVSLIVGHVAKGNFANIAEGEIKPGWARIKLHNSNDYRSAFPVHVNANGFECKIPFGVEVDVPIRVLESLDNAVEHVVYKNEFDERAQKMTQSYPYQLIGKVDGPDPRPGLEIGREARLSVKRRYR